MPVFSDPILSSSDEGLGLGYKSARPSTRHRLLAMSEATHMLPTLMISAGAVVVLVRNLPVTAGMAAVSLDFSLAPADDARTAAGG